VQGCHPECKICIKVGAGIHPNGGHGPVVTYRCDDILTNFYNNAARTTAAEAAFLGGGF
jgi:hypothetical protein